MKLNLDRDSEAVGFVNILSFKFVEMLMFDQNREVDAWSRF